MYVAIQVVYIVINTLCGMFMEHLVTLCGVFMER